MLAFSCQICGHLLTFESSLCLSCGTPQGYDPRSVAVVGLPTDYSTACAAAARIGCNWQVPNDEVDAYGGLCASCRITRTRPPETDVEAQQAFARTESDKRRLVFQLVDLGLPVEPGHLAFDLLSSAEQQVTIGHADGVVTIDLAEGDDAHREEVRRSMGEPYRTMLGHLRHEVGHYYWQVLVEAASGEVLGEFRRLFGDERADYALALQTHYSQPARPGWNDTHVSTYAAAHPWEDFAETFAHYLHIRDALQSAAAYGVTVSGPLVAQKVELSAIPMLDGHDSDAATLVSTWLALTFALNAVNRSMGKDDLYPFVLSGTVVGKLAFVHSLVTL